MLSQILIIDDDLKICQLLQKLFQNNNYVCFYVENTKEARKMLLYIKFNLLIVDYMMPEENGIDFIKDLRINKINIPALMLTAIDDIENKIQALGSGTDDYLTKPFNSQEILLRVKNLISRNNTIESNTANIIIQNLIFNLTTNKLTLNGEPINLSTSEEDIFKVFATNLNKVVTKEEILSALGKPINANNINGLNVSIMRLRKKLEQDDNSTKYLKTIRNKGFILIK